MLKSKYLIPNRRKIRVLLNPADDLSVPKVQRIEGFCWE